SACRTPYRARSAQISQKPCQPSLSLGPRASRPHRAPQLGLALRCVEVRAGPPRSQEGGRQGVAQFLRKVAESEAQWSNPPPSGAHRVRNCAREFNAFLAAKRTARRLA